MLTTDLVKATCLLLSLVDANAETSVSIHSENVVICPQETVTFTCTVQSGRALQWEAKPFITRTLNQIIFLPNDIMPTRDFISSGVRFEAVLTQSELIQDSSTHYTLQSTLSTTASTTTNGTVIECQEYYTAAYDNSTLQLNELAPPSNVQYSVISYGTSEVTGDIEWNSSMNSPVDKFTITVSSLDGSIDLGTVASSPLENVTLNYNINYNISVRASNCAGSSIPGVILFMEPGCPPPGQPVNGSVSGFTSARVGSEVTYYCDEGLNLVGERVAVCTLQLVWEPMGTKVMCKHSPGTISSTYNPTPTPDPNPSTTTTATTTTTTNTNRNTNTTTTISSSQSLGAAAVGGIVVAVLFLVFISILSVVIFVLLLKRFNISKKSGPGYENGAAKGKSYTTGEKIVDLQQVCDSSVVPATYSAVGHVQESPPMKNKVQYSTMDHISKAPTCPVTELVMSHIDRSIDPEQIQMKLVVVKHQWRRLGSAVGLPPQFLDEVLSSYEEDKDRLAEVVYEWCSRVQNIHWTDVAAMCRNIGHSDLANALDKAYQTVIPLQDPQTSPNELYELNKPMKCTDNKAYQTISAPGTISPQYPVTSSNILYELHKPIKCQGNRAYETVSSQALPSSVEVKSIAQEVQVPPVYEEIVL